jgi:nicotinate phosphoribosyltransferase
MVMLSAPTKCVEFGLRRAQGPNGALTASKYAYLGGFEASSNVMAGYHFGVPVAGTLAHSMIMSYEDESDVAHSRKLSLPDGSQIDVLDEAMTYRAKLGWNSTQLKELYAFVAFATAYPTTFSSLVDSYNTKESGLKNFLLVSLVLAHHGFTPLSIRLDSGDLASLS